MAINTTRSDFNAPIDQRRRVHYCWEMTTPGTREFQSSQSFILLQVAVPPQDHEPGDIFRLVVGDNIEFEHALDPLIDMYRPEFKSSAKLHLEIEQQFSVLLDAVLDGKLSVPAIERLRELHKEMAAPAEYACVGIRIARAVLVPPRHVLRVETTRGQRMTVYLGGLLSYDPSPI